MQSIDNDFSFNDEENIDFDTVERTTEESDDLIDLEDIDENEEEYDDDDDDEEYDDEFGEDSLVDDGDSSYEEYDDLDEYLYNEDYDGDE